MRPQLHCMRFSSFPKSDKSIPSEFTRTSDRRNQRNVTAARSIEKPKMSAQRYAVFLLGRYEYSAAGLRDKLIRRGYSKEESDGAMAFVQQHNLQSDERFASSKARSRQARAGDRKILLTLKAKGVADSVATAQIAMLDPEIERARQAAERFRDEVSRNGLTLELRQKVYRRLAGRGFSASSIKSALRSLEEETGFD